MINELFYTIFEGKQVIDYSRHVLEDVFPGVFSRESQQPQFYFSNKKRPAYNKSISDDLCEMPQEYALRIEPEANISAPKQIEVPKEVLLNYVADDFQNKLFQLLEEKGYQDKLSDFYNKAGISRQLFANILSYNKEYTPSKETLYKIIMTLELDYSEARNLLSTKGYTMSKSLKLDVIMGYCIENKIYEQERVDRILMEHAGTTLFSER
ncbi:MAG: helix-turn-helix transcriptional regulator [Bacillota bacterium]